MPTPPSDLMSVAQPPADLVAVNQPPHDLIAAAPAARAPRKPFLEDVSTTDPSTTSKLGTLASAADLALAVPSMATHFISTVGEAVEGGVASPWTGKGLKEVWHDASERGNEASAMWANPLERATHATGLLEKEYQESAPAQIMKRVGELQKSGTTKLEETTGIPSEMSDTALEGFMLSMPAWFKSRAAKTGDKATAEARMKGAQPTGTQPPPDLSSVPDIEKRMDTQPLPEDSAPNVSGRVAEMRKRSASMKPDEPIAHPDEGKLDDVLPFNSETVEQYANRAGSEIGGVSHLQGIVSELQRDYIKQGRKAGRAKLEYLAENAPESSGFSIEVATPRFIDELDAELARRAASFKPPYKPSPEASQEIHAALAEPELAEGRRAYELHGQEITGDEIDAAAKQHRDWLAGKNVERRAEPSEQTARTEVARDVAAEKVAGIVKADQVKQLTAARKAKVGKQLNLVQTIKQMGGIHTSHMLDIVGEKRTGKGVSGIPPGVFHNAGRGLDDLATVLKDKGYDINTDDVDGGVQQLRDMIRADLNGETQLPMEAAFDEFERMYRGHAREEGKINKTLLIGGAAVAGGAAVGAAMYKDSPIEGALIGAGAGFGIARVAHVLHDIGAGVSLQSAINVVKSSVDPIRAKAIEVNNGKIARVKAGLREIAAIQKAYMKAVPDKARREHITHVVQSGDLSSLSPTERYFVSKVEQAYGQMGSAAQAAGVIGHLLGKEYVPMMWDLRDTSTKAFFDDLLSSSAGDSATAGTFTPHSLHRSVPTYLQGMAGKLKPLTLDHAELLGIYAKSVLKATENANALYALKSMKLPNNMYAVEPIGKGVPRDYITDHKISGLEGFAVHPEMIDALRTGFDSYKPGVIQKAMLSVAFTAKRLAVTYSLFHPMSLLVAYTGAGGNPFGYVAGAAARGAEKLTGNRIKIPYQSAVDKALEQYEQGGAKDTTDYLIRNGLEIGGGIEDTVGRDSFLKLTGFADKLLFSDKTGLKPFTAVDEGIHQFTWGYTHTGMKLVTAGREFERMLADPKNAGKDINQIAADATSYTNNIFGGLNWERMIDGMKSKAGRAVAGAAYSKHGRAVMQTGLFAPDWLLSTMRSWTQAVPGLSENAAVGQMARAYVARSLLYTMVVTDALNYHYSGHHVWDNDFRSQREKDADSDNTNRTIMDQIHDMTFIDMGDGTRIEGNKHLFEFAHAITEPGQFAMGKLSSTASDPLNMAMNKQWLSPTWAPKITEGGTGAQKAKDYAKWFVEHHAPISLQQLGQGAYGGTFGFPRHGKTDEDKDDLAEKRRNLKEERDSQ